MRKIHAISKILLKIPYKKKHEKIMLLSTFLLLLIVTIFSIFNCELYSRISFLFVLIPIVNFACTILCAILFFIKENYYLQSLILFVQSITSTFLGHEVIGAILFSSLFVLLLINNFFLEKKKTKIMLIVSCSLFLILTLIPFSVQEFLLILLMSFFVVGFYYYVYIELEEKLIHFQPLKSSSLQETLGLPEKGGNITLTEFGLTERQEKLVKDYIDTRASYKELSKKYYISISTVKKDMKAVFNLLRVRDINELYLLLSQYIL